MKKLDRIGVFLCWCGANIARSVDVTKVIEEIKNYPGVVHAEDYIYMCSDPGQDLIRQKIKEFKLDGLVIANCSPTLHEKTFRNLAEGMNLNRFRCEIANVREQCSWPHEHEKEIATQKAIILIKSVIEKIKLNSELHPAPIPLTKKALIIGGGVTGIQAALDIADGGYDVYLVERLPSIGGHMLQLSETFPTLDCPQCIMTPKMTEASQHENIHLLTYSEIEDVSGYLGNFKVNVRRKARYVDEDKCIGCGDCAIKCPTKVPSEYECGLAMRKAIYIPFPQAVPAIYTIDSEHCRYFQKGKCGVCAKVCKADAIDYTQEDRIEELDVGAIIVATGFDLYDKEALKEYGYGDYEDVLDGLQFERLLAASGPTGGKILRPSDGSEAKQVVFIQCCGSRDPELGMPYCSQVCCMYTAKQALLYKHAVPDGQAFVFYIDVRTAGKGYEEFAQRAIEQEKIVYLRGKVSKVYREDNKVVVMGADTLSGRQIEIEADIVVLATAVVPSEGVKDLASKLRISTDEHGFIKEAHLKLRPVETLTSGIYLAGMAQSPKDITDSVSQGSAAASKILSLFSNEELLHDPTVAVVDMDVCSGCGICEEICAYQAVKVDPKTKKAEVNDLICEGCGACAATCPSGAIQHKNFKKRQIYDMIDVVCEEYV